jgi:hypothetical protein
MSTEKTVNLSLLDKNIDDIDDLAGYETPVNGVYSLKLSTALKVVAMKGVDKDCVEANFEVVECLEQNNPEDPASKAGTKFSMLFQLGNETAEGKMKELLLPLCAHYGERSLLKMVTDVLKEPTVITATIKRRKDKDDPEKFYPMVSNVVVA